MVFDVSTVEPIIEPSTEAAYQTLQTNRSFIPVNKSKQESHTGTGVALQGADEGEGMAAGPPLMHRWKGARHGVSVQGGQNCDISN